nr:glutamate decarboxylase [Tanacetum cinerariifolium]
MEKTKKLGGTGLAYAGVGWVLWRTKEDLHDELVFHMSYLGSDVPTFTLNFSKVMYDSIVYEFMVYESVVYEWMMYEFVVCEFVVYEFVVYEFVVYESVMYELVVYDSCVARLDFTMVYEFIAYEWVKMPPKRTTTTTTTPMTDVTIKALIAQGVATALAEYEANRGSGNGDDSHDSGSGRRTDPVARECTYINFLKCQPLNFKGTEGVVRLNQWFEKMESVFHISNYTVGNLVKYATCTLLGNALMW